MIRTWKNGDTMSPKTITIYPQNGDIKTGWADPVVEMTHKVTDSRDGTVYTPEGIGFDKISISEAVARGIWTAEEAQMMVGLCLKLYCEVCAPLPVVEEVVSE